MRSFGFDDAAINAVTQNLNEMGLTITKITTQLENDDDHTVVIKVQGIDELGRAVTAIRSIRDEYDQVEENGEKKSVKRDRPTVREGKTTIKQSFVEAGNEVEDETEIRKTKYAYDELIKTIREMGSIKKEISGLDNVKDAERIEVLTVQLDKLQLKYNGIVQDFETKFDAAQIVSVTEELRKVGDAVDVVNAKMADKKNAEFTKKFNQAFDISNKLQLGDFDKDSFDIENNFSKITNKSEEAISAVDEFRSALIALHAAEDSGDVNGIIKAYDKYQDAFKKAKNALSINVKVDADEVKQTANEFKELYGIGKKIDNLEFKIKGLDDESNSNEIAELKAQLEALRQTYRQLLSELQGQLSESQLAKLTADALEANERLDQLEAKFKDTRANAANKIADRLSDGDFGNQFDDIKTDFDSLKNATDETKAAFEEFNNAYNKLKTTDTSDIDALIAANEEYVNALKKVKNQLDINARSERQIADTTKLKSAKEAFSSEMDVWLYKNSAAAKQFGNAINEIKARLVSCDATDLDGLKAEFKEIIRQATLAGKTTQTFGDKLKKKFSDYGAYFSVASLTNYAEQAIRSMYDNVVKIDSAMTELMKVTNETDSSYRNFLSNASTMAKEIGSTIDSVISSTADFARLGFTFDESQTLAKVANVYSVVGDDIESVETATQSIISTMTAFDVKVEDSMSIADKFNEVGNRFAITSGGIGDALQRSASSMSAAGNTLDETIALITAANTVVQDADSVGTAFKTISMRIRGAKTDLEEAGLETEGMAASTASLRKEILALSGVDIMINDSTFKSTYQILDELSAKWQELTDIQQASITELIAGKRQGNIISSLMSNFDIAREALGVSEGSSEGIGSAMKEHAKWMESLEARIQKLQAAWQSLSQTVLSSDLLKNLIDWLTGLVTFLDNVIDKVGLLNTVIAGVGIGKAIKSISSVSKAAGGLSSLVDVSSLLSLAFPNAANGIGIFTSALSKSTSIIGVVKAAISGLWTVISAHPIIAAISAVGLLAVSFAKLHTSAKEANEKMEEAFSAYDDAKQNVIDTNKELENTKTKIDELQTKGGLSFVEQAELEKLKQATEYLQIQADLAEKEEERKAKEAAEAAVEAYKKNYQHEISKDATDEYIQNAEWSGNNAILFSDASDISAMVAGIRQMEKLRDEAKIGSEDWEHFNGIINDATDSIWEQVDALAGYKGKLEALPELSDSQQEILDSINDAIKYIYLELRPDKWKQIQFDKIFDNKAIADAKNELVNLAKENKAVGITVDDITSKYPELASKIVSSLKAIDKNFTLQDFVDYINSEAGSINVDEYTRQAKEKLEESMSEAVDSVSDEKVDTELEIDVKVKEASLSEINEWLDSFEGEDRIIACDIIFDNDTTGWSIDDFQNKFNEIKEPVKIPISFPELMADEGFVGTIDSHIEKVNTLQEAYKAFKDGDFEALDFVELVKEFPELADNADDLDVAIVELLKVMNQDIVSEFSEQFGNMETDEDIESLQSFMDYVLELGEVVGDTQFSIDFEAETEGMDKFFSAVKESVSATGLSAESIKELKSRYQDLEDYDPARLFERTENGIHLNTKALRELESAYEKQAKSKLDKQLNDYVKQYNDLTKEIDKTSDTAERADLYAQRDNIRNQINDTANLISQYEGLTSAFYKWQQAQSMGEEGDMYDSLAGSLENIKQLYDDGLIGTNKFRTAVQLMSNEDLSNASADELLAAYEAGYPKMQRYFTDSEKGCLNFLNDVQALNSEWVHMNQDDSWDIDFGVGGDQDIADALGINVEAVQSILRKLSDYGLDINLDSATTSIEGLESTIEETEAKLKELGKDPVDIEFNCNTENLDEEIKNAQGKIAEINNSDVEPEVKTAQLDDANAKLDLLISRKIEASQPTFMSIDASSVDTKLQSTLTLLQEYQTAVNNLTALELKGADASEIKAAQTEVDELASKINALPDDVKTTIGIETSDSIEDIKSKIANDEVKISVGAEVVGTEEVNLLKEALDALKSKFVTATAVVFGTKLVNNLVDAISKLSNKTVTIETIHKDIYVNSSSIGGISGGVNNTKMLAKVNGTAFVNGTVGKAFKQGNWGIKGSGTALGGELGQEIVVRDGRYFTIGDNGAEFFNYKRGDIIFNHKQTEELFKNGKVTSNNGRGKALVNGTAFAEGNAFSGGSGSIVVGGKVKTSSSGGGSGPDDSDEDEFKEKFDWIEIAIDRIERAISSLDLKANSVYKSWSSRNENLKKEITEIGNEITLQQSGYERYMQEANSVGLSENWAKLVRDGAIDISTITDEDLAEKIGEYQEW